MKQEVDSWRSKCEQMKANFTSQLGAWQDALAVSRIAQARSEREEMKNRVQAATARYGNITIQRTGTMLTEVWEDGCLFTDLIDRQEQIAKQRESIDKRLKSMRQKSRCCSSSCSSEREAARSRRNWSLYFIHAR